MGDAAPTASAVPKRLVSILDTDLYKHAILSRYPNVEATYRFTNRSSKIQPFTSRCVKLIRQMIDGLEKCALTDEEYAWLKKTMPQFPLAYLDYLKAYRFKPRDEVHIRFERHDTLEPPDHGGSKHPDEDAPGSLEILISGDWARTILYEVPILAIISEAYFATVDTDWDYRGQVELAKTKTLRLLDAGCAVTDFGTRRRRSYHAQDLVISGMSQATAAYGSKGKGKVGGTSNVHFAMKYGIAPVGTIAHELFMGVGALEGYDGANGRVLDLWEEIYKGDLTIALTDTFSTKAFWEDYCSDAERAKRWKGLRQDSGDPATFAKVAKAKWLELGIDPSSKVIIFSDGLDVEKCIELQELCDKEGIGCAFGVGTNLTNDFRKVGDPDRENVSGGGKPRQEGRQSGALNIVIKLATVDDHPCIKLSDDLTKNTGDPEMIKMVKRRYGLEVGIAMDMGPASHGPHEPAAPAGSLVW